LEPTTPHGRSAVIISSLANGALGEHCRQETDGIRLEIEAGAVPVERPLEQTVKRRRHRRIGGEYVGGGG
jgi:hypothetical protein